MGRVAAGDNLGWKNVIIDFPERLDRIKFALILGASKRDFNRLPTNRCCQFSTIFFSNRWSGRRLPPFSLIWQECCRLHLPVYPSAILEGEDYGFKVSITNKLSGGGFLAVHLNASLGGFGLNIYQSGMKCCMPTRTSSVTCRSGSFAVGGSKPITTVWKRALFSFFLIWRQTVTSLYMARPVHPGWSCRGWTATW